MAFGQVPLTEEDFPLSFTEPEAAFCSNQWIEIIPSVIMRPPETLVECEISCGTPFFRLDFLVIQPPDAKSTVPQMGL